MTTPAQKRELWMLRTVRNHGLEPFHQTHHSVKQVRRTVIYLPDYHYDTPSTDREKAAYFTPTSRANACLYALLNPPARFADGDTGEHVPTEMIEDAQWGETDPLWEIDIEEPELDDPSIQFHRVFSDGHIVDIEVPYSSAALNPAVRMTVFDELLAISRYNAEYEQVEPYDNLDEYYGIK